MFIDITLIVIFLVSLGVLSFLVSRKLPHLATVPQEEIDRYLEERYRAVFVPFHRVKKFYNEERLLAAVLDYSGRFLHRLHIIVMRIDNGIVGLLKKVRSQSIAVNGNGNAEQKNVSDMRAPE